MLKRNSKKFFLYLFTLILYFTFFVVFPVAVRAQEVQLPPGIVIGDDKGIHVNHEGEYLVDIRDILPGKKWKTTIHLMNVERDEPYVLTLQIKPPVVHGPIDFSKAIAMKLDYDGKTIYEGTVAGTGNQIDLQKKPYSLGVYRSGDSHVLQVSFVMDDTYTVQDFQEKSVTENVWVFRAEKAKIDSPSSSIFKGRLPRTGEEWRDFLLYSCLGLFLLLIVLLLIKKEMEKIKQRNKI